VINAIYNQDNKVKHNHDDHQANHDPTSEHDHLHLPVVSNKDNLDKADQCQN